MKMMKLALLGGAALAVMAVSAQADDLSALKAEIDALNARVAQLEATPSVPAGYSLLTVGSGPAMIVPGNNLTAKELAAYGTKATVISVLPTADVPAATVIEWSGYARAAIRYSNYGGPDVKITATETEDGDPTTVVDGFDRIKIGVEDNKNWDVPSRGQLKVVGKTDTAVGEVGARIQVRGDFDTLDVKATVKMNEAWGWWAMTPELTLGGGYTGSLGNIGYGYDGACNCYYTDNADVAFNPGDASQMRLSYASGPFSMGIAIEDDSGSLTTTQDNSGQPAGYTKFGGVGSTAIGVAGNIKYTGDSFNGGLFGVWHNTDSNGGTFDDSWQAGAGVGFALGDMASISLAAAAGRIVNGQDFWGVSGLASVNLSDAVHAEVAGGYKNYSGKGNTTSLASFAGFAPNPVTTPFDTATFNWGTKPDVIAVLAGIYYDPVPQLTIGLEGEWFQNDSYKVNVNDVTENKTFHFNVGSTNNYDVDLVTVFRF